MGVASAAMGTKPLERDLETIRHSDATPWVPIPLGGHMNSCRQSIGQEAVQHQPPQVDLAPATLVLARHRLEHLLGELDQTTAGPLQGH